MYFVESRIFTARCSEFLNDEELAELQWALAENPEAAPVIPDCAGLRKLRWAVTGSAKGKRGGCRIIYLNHSDNARIDLIAIYGKNEQDDLGPEQRKALASLVRTLRSEVRNIIKRK